MNSLDGYDACVRAFNALAEAHAAVSAKLTMSLRKEVGLSINEFDTLLCLSLQPDGLLPLSELYAPARLSQPAVSRMVDRLEERGLVTRISGDIDRRKVMVALSSAGTEVLRRALPVHAKGVSDHLLSPLTEEECSSFKSIMTKVMANITSEADKETPAL